MRYLLLVLILTLIAGCSCSERLDNYSREQFLEMAREGDPDLQIRTPKSITESLVNCRDYTPACRFGYRVVIKRIEMVVLYYESQENALNAAKRAKAYVSRNWVLDEVRGEPILERFVVKYLKAKPAF